ncbi:MAG: hypothetical protein H8E94_04150 [Alphaproteobacteria bacterium]|nr:hypothetical protein [Alphaproteobacteria bacterium]
MQHRMAFWWKRVGFSVGGQGHPAGEAELKALMHDPRYSDPHHPQHIAYRQMIADGFRAAFDG